MVVELPDGNWAYCGGNGTVPPDMFFTTCVCPRCGLLEAHTIRDIEGDDDPFAARRICIDCGFKWSQNRGN